MRASPPQFSLHRLFGIVTLCSVLFALAAPRGLDATVVLAGVFFCLLNFLGIFAYVQRQELPARILIGIGYGLFVLSFFSPAFQSPDGLVYTGWEATIVCVSGVRFFIVSLFWFGQGEYSIWLSGAHWFLWLLALVVANVIVTLYPAVKLLRKKIPGPYAAALWIAFVFMWSVPLVTGLSSLRYGYFFWCGFSVIFIASNPITPRQLTGVVSVAAALLILMKFYFS